MQERWLVATGYYSSSVVSGPSNFAVDA